MNAKFTQNMKNNNNCFTTCSFLKLSQVFEKFFFFFLGTQYIERLLVAPRPLPRATHVVSPRPLLYPVVVAKRARRARERPPRTVVEVLGAEEVLVESDVSSISAVLVSFHTIFLRCDDCALAPSKIKMIYL